MSSERKAVQAIIALHPHPEELLCDALQSVMTMFKPHSEEQTVNFLIEYLMPVSKLGALVLAAHVDDHPEDSKECVPQLLKSFQAVLEKLVREHFQVLVDKSDLFDPFAQSGINRQTYEDIMASIKQGHSNG
ncbi:MAG: hypothetical protein KAJ19_25545 [Gammaproteobacteria bacterium]|nr:hypothetical protein [Gammaproteobacteria bacterium]